MEIPHPRRILVLGPPDSGILSFLKDLTGTEPPAPLPSSLPPPPSSSGSSAQDESAATRPPPPPSIAGLSHSWRLETKYYTATVPIWIDEIPWQQPTGAPAPSSSDSDADAGAGAVSGPAAWAAEYSSDAAREVLDVVGAWVVCFRKPVDRRQLEHIKACLRAVADVNAHAHDGGGDALLLGVAMPQSISPCLEISGEEWEDLGIETGGFEIVDSEAAGGKNEFGELTGIPRAREALEANEWESPEELLGVDDIVGGEPAGDEEDIVDSMMEKDTMEIWREMFGLRESIAAGGDVQPDEDIEDEGGGEGEGEGKEKKKGEGEDEEGQVEELEGLMRKVVAVREMGSGLSETDRKRLAARTVNEIMGSR